MQNQFQGMNKDTVLKALWDRQWYDVVEQIEQQEHLFETEPDDEYPHSFTNESIQTLACILLATGKAQKDEEIEAKLHRRGRTICIWRQNEKATAMLYIGPAGKIENVMGGRGPGDNWKENTTLSEATLHIQEGRNLA